MKINWNSNKPRIELHYNPVSKELRLISSTGVRIISITALNGEVGYILFKVNSFDFKGSNMANIEKLEFRVQYWFGTVYYKYSDFIIG